MPFIDTNDRGLVNLAHVREARGDTGKYGRVYRLDDKDGESLGTVSSRLFENTVEQMIAPTEAFECLQVWFEKDGSHFVTVTNVIAWGMTTIGNIVPLTSDSSIFPPDNYALRRKGEAKIEVPDDATYPSEEEWVKAKVKEREEDKARESKAALK